jgi:hypothetical protein
MRKWSPRLLISTSSLVICFLSCQVCGKGYVKSGGISDSPLGLHEFKDIFIFRCRCLNMASSPRAHFDRTGFFPKKSSVGAWKELTPHRRIRSWSNLYLFDLLHFLPTPMHHHKVNQSTYKANRKYSILSLRYSGGINTSSLLCSPARFCQCLAMHFLQWGEWLL